MKSRVEYEAIIARWRAQPPGLGDVVERRVDWVFAGSSLVPWMNGVLTRVCKREDATLVGAVMCSELSAVGEFMDARHIDNNCVLFEVTIRRPLDLADGPASYGCDEVAALAGVGGGL